jgi:hypothetical protein
MGRAAGGALDVIDKFIIPFAEPGIGRSARRLRRRAICKETGETHSILHDP